MKGGFRANVFFSYSRRDSDVLAALLAQVEKTIPGDSIQLFVDTGLQSGDLWLRRIKRALGQMDIAVLLVSQSFLDSPFIGRIELPAIRKAARNRRVVVIPIFLEPCDLQKHRWLKQFQFPIPAAVGFRHLDDAKKAAALNKVSERVGQLAARVGPGSRFVRRHLLNWRFSVPVSLAAITLATGLFFGAWRQIQAPQVRNLAQGVPLTTCRAETLGSVAQLFERGWLVAKFDTNEFLVVARTDEDRIHWRRYNAAEFIKGPAIRCEDSDAEQLLARGFRWLYCQRAPEIAAEIGKPLSNEVRAWIQYQSWSSGLFAFGLPSTPQRQNNEQSEFQILSGLLLHSPTEAEGSGRQFGYSEASAPESVYCTALWYPSPADGKRNIVHQAVADSGRCDRIVDGASYIRPRPSCSLSGY